MKTTKKIHELSIWASFTFAIAALATSAFAPIIALALALVALAFSIALLVVDMKIRRYKEKIVCGAQTTMHIIESDGREFDETLEFEMFIGGLSCLIIAIAITLIYIAPIASVMQYPITMQVFYPNHPNMTITQNCTGFTTSESGYLNGQPINETNTTTCILPYNIAKTTNPFTCSIQNKTITCDVANYYIWSGTILNVSKR